MPDVKRRDIFALSGALALHPLMIGGAEATPQIDPVTWGLQLRIIYSQTKGWLVPVIDWDSMEGEWTHWYPGMVPIFKHVPLAEYLIDLENKLQLKTTTVWQQK